MKFLVIMFFIFPFCVGAQSIEKDFSVKEKLDNPYLKSIRENYKRVNAIKNWSAIKPAALDESGEGGEAKYYYSSGLLQKIVARHFSETFQQINEYYFFKGQISFVLEKTIKYNRPFYYDSTTAAQNQDTQAFDIKKSNTEERRSYFNNGTLFKQINTADHPLSLSKKYLQEEAARIKNDVTELKKYLKKQSLH